MPAITTLTFVQTKTLIGWLYIVHYIQELSDLLAEGKDLLNQYNNRYYLNLVSLQLE